MDAIIKNDHVYVVIKDKEERDGVNLMDSENLILSSDDNSEKSLYGGRVLIKPDRGDYSLYVDGIKLEGFREGYNSNIVYFDYFGIEAIAAYLNQMENLGIDSFLDNYKTQLQKLKEDLEAIGVDNSDMKDVLSHICCILFLLFINMNAGLSNQAYSEAYDAIINMYF